MGVAVDCLLVIRSVPVLIQNEVCCVGVACTLHITSDRMAVIKELRWLAAAGECGSAATSYRLENLRQVREANTLRDYIMDVY